MPSASQPDLFGAVPQSRAAGDPAAAAAPDPSLVTLRDSPILRPVPPGGHTADTIRAMFLDLIAAARAAETMPWDARDVRAHTAMAPYLAEWLKNGEGDRLLAEFKAEMDRLDAPADQVAPNWRRIWGLAA